MADNWLHATDDLGESPFGRLQRCGHSSVACLRTLLLDIDASDGGANEPAIHRAAREARVADVRAELERGESLDCENEYGWTPLFWAGVNGNLDLAKLMVNRGADINHRDTTYTGLTPLALAKLMGYDEVAGYLGSRGGIS